MSDEEFVAKMRERFRARAARFEQIKHLRDRVKLQSTGYAHKKYTVVLDDETRQLSNDDLLLLCDEGNACFGGRIGHRGGGSVPVEIYTD